MRTPLALLVLGLLAGPALAEGAGDAARAQSIQALQDRVDALRAALAGDVCADPAAARALLAGTGAPVDARPAKADGGNPAGKPPTPGSEDQAKLAPPSETRSDGPTRKLARGELVERLHQSVVMVISEHDTGSGFFVAPNVVITNSHVVESATSPQVVVVGRGLGGPRPATILAKTGSKVPGGRDYAILAVQGPPAGTVLPLSPGITELSPVVAAGYPGLLLENDMNFRALIRGDMNAMPDLAMSQGTVMAIQNRERGLPTLAHSAPISGGNSGGPLVDACGRAVGINTFINVAVRQASHAGFALGIGDMAGYLRQNGVEPALRTGPCED